MPRYLVDVDVEEISTLSFKVEVEAASEEQARDAALEKWQTRRDDYEARVYPGGYDPGSARTDAVVLLGENGHA